MNEEPMHELMDINDVCRFFGGTRPLDKSTIFRWIKEGRIAPSIKMSGRVQRWRRSECENILATMEGKRAVKDSSE